jgi:hypothetical protein
MCPKYGPLSDRNDDSKRDPESIGECIIFNHQIYEPSTGFSEREGTELDAQELKKAFLTMGFGVSQYDNRSVSQIFEILSNGMSITFNNFFDSYDAPHFSRSPSYDRPLKFFFQCLNRIIVTGNVSSFAF